MTELRRAEGEAPPRRGIVFILSAPSGAGKTTISREALLKIDGLAPSVSVTTRRPREGERDGVDYHFVEPKEFEQRAARAEFAESARVFDSNYGTPRGPLEDAIAAGHDILLDIDVQGAAQIRQKYTADVVTVFVLPPSFVELEERLRRRATDAESAIQRRLARASQEALCYPQYDYLIINRQVADSIMQLAAIVGAERLRVRRLTEAFQPWKV